VGGGWRPLAVFIVLTFCLTWAVWVPRAAGVDVGVIGQLWTWMPAVAAIVSAALVTGRQGVRELLGRLFRWRVAWWWYLIVLAGPAAFSALVAAVSTVLGVSWSAARPAWLATPLLQLLVFFVILTLTDGLGEETAWRGYALPHLLRRFRALAASLVLAVIWAAWHLPLIWTEGSVLFGYPIWLLVLDLAAKSVLFTWVFLRTRGSALLAVLLHASTNLFAVSPAVQEGSDLTVALVALGAKWLLVLAVLRSLTRSELEARSAGTAETTSPDGGPA
jgi:membrane protease YdiL (CAAX protease family)